MGKKNSALGSDIQSLAGVPAGSDASITALCAFSIWCVSAREMRGERQGEREKGPVSVCCQCEGFVGVVAYSVSVRATAVSSPAPPMGSAARVLLSPCAPCSGRRHVLITFLAVSLWCGFARMRHEIGEYTWRDVLGHRCNLASPCSSRPSPIFPPKIRCDLPAFPHAHVFRCLCHAKTNDQKCSSLDEQATPRSMGSVYSPRA